MLYCNQHSSYAILYNQHSSYAILYNQHSSYAILSTVIVSITLSTVHVLFLNCTGWGVHGKSARGESTGSLTKFLDISGSEPSPNMSAEAAGIKHEHSHSTHILKEETHTHTHQVWSWCVVMKLCKRFLCSRILYIQVKKCMMLFGCGHSKRRNRIVTEQRKTVDDWLKKCSISSRSLLAFHNKIMISRTLPIIEKCVSPIQVLLSQ